MQADGMTSASCSGSAASPEVCSREDVMLALVAPSWVTADERARRGWRGGRNVGWQDDHPRAGTRAHRACARGARWRKHRRRIGDDARARVRLDVEAERATGAGV